MENIIENNKLIAEFLDWEFDDLSETFETPFLKLVDPQAFGDEQFSCKLQDFELEFHTDWNWLMSVVEKIGNLQDENNCAIYNVQIEQSFTEIIDNHTSATLANFHTLPTFSIAHHAYRATVSKSDITHAGSSSTLL